MFQISNKTTRYMYKFTCKLYDWSLHIRDCQIFFNFPDVTVSVQQRKYKFLKRYATSENCVCRAFRNVAQSELRTIVHTFWLVWCILWVDSCFFRLYYFVLPFHREISVNAASDVVNQRHWSRPTSIEVGVALMEVAACACLWPCRKPSAC
jgi:hypothetical protein